MLNYTAIRGVKVLAQYLTDPSTLESAQKQIEEWLSDTTLSAKGVYALQVIAATLFMYADNLKEAIKSVRSVSTMEQ